MVETFVQSTDDVVKFLKDQHNLIKDMFDDVLSASSAEAREKSFIALRQLLAVHETAEEMVVHPRARREIADGDAIVDARLHEEHAAKEHLSKLEGMDVGFQGVHRRADQLPRRGASSTPSTRRTEEFTQAASATRPPMSCKRMAGAVQAAEAIAPTRPHAGVESAKSNFAARAIRVDARPGP